MKQTKNYGDLPPQYSCAENAHIVIIPAPYDRTSTWIKGAEKGPEAIIEASAHMELYDTETDSEVYLNGIYTAEPLQIDMNPEQMVKQVDATVADWLQKDKFCVVLGGEHSVSIGAIQAVAQRYADLTVLQLDAHTDLRDEYSGSRYNHACVMARTREICPIIQVGIRSMDVSEKQNIAGKSMYLAEKIHGRDGWIEDCVANLTENVYVTIDLDVFDSSVMPSTGTPEPGGLLWYEVLKLLKLTCARKNVVGFDVVELCPSETTKAPDFLAAKLIYKFLSYKFGDHDGKG